jgi:hypothetical protein
MPCEPVLGRFATLAGTPGGLSGGGPASPKLNLWSPP